MFDFVLFLHRSRGSLDELAAWFIWAAMTSLGDVDLPLRGSAGSPNGGGGSVGHGPAMAFSSS
jgi:hypothetical protein